MGIVRYSMAGSGLQSQLRDFICLFLVFFFFFHELTKLACVQRSTNG